MCVWVFPIGSFQLCAFFNCKTKTAAFNLWVPYQRSGSETCEIFAKLVGGMDVHWFHLAELTFKNHFPA